MSLISKFMVAILILAIISVIVSQNSATAGFMQSMWSTFGRLLSIVVSPIGAPVTHTTNFSAPK